MTELEAIKYLHRVLHYNEEIKKLHNEPMIKQLDQFMDTLLGE